MQIHSIKRITEILRGDFDTDFIKIFHYINWILLLSFVFASYYMYDLRIAISVFLGALIATVNCIGLDRDCVNLLRLKSVFAYMSRFAVRLGLILLAVTALFLFFPKQISSFAFLVGLSVVVVNFYIWVLGILVFKVIDNNREAA